MAEAAAISSRQGPVSRSIHPAALPSNLERAVVMSGESQTKPPFCSASWLVASDLSAAWQGRERFVILTTGPQSALLLRATVRAWRDDSNRCDRLFFIVLEPLLGKARSTEATAPLRTVESTGRTIDGGTPPRLADRSLRAPGFRLASFASGRVNLLRGRGEPAALLREIVAEVDAFWLPAADAGHALLGSGSAIGKGFARIAAPHATIVAAWADEAARRKLHAAGFIADADADGDVEREADRRAETRLYRARYEPAFSPRRPVGRRAVGPAVERRALIVGAGLAGCAAAWALAEQGWSSHIVERHDAVASEASGNLAGLYHGIVNGRDGTHARFNRAASLAAHAAVLKATNRHGVRGAAEGLLQLADASTDLPRMRQLLERLGLPAGYVRAVDADEASACAGLRLARPAWFYRAAGWVDPAGLARSFLERAGAAVRLSLGLEVARLRRDAGQWSLLDPQGHVIDTASTVVLANAGDALRLAGDAWAVEGWPVESVRGQVSVLAAARQQSVLLPRVPITGAGYLLPDVDGRLIFGATATRADPDPSVRMADHHLNLDQLARLAPSLTAAACIDLQLIEGRTAWRWTSRDRLPLIGGVPACRREREDRAFGFAPTASASPPQSRAIRLDQPRLVPRNPGLFLFTALGSRGITWSALGAQMLASTITGSPSPVEASLLDAVDPARFVVRENRRSSRQEDGVSVDPPAV